MLKDALAYLASSKTLVLWMALAVIVLACFLFSTIILVAFGVDNPYFNDILNWMGIAGGGGTARNIVNDGIMPRVPQAVGANKDPSVAVQSPMSMAPAVTAPTGQYIPSMPQLEEA